MTTTTNRIDFQWPAAVMYCITTAALTFLVYTGKLHAEVFMSLVAWLIPSPYLDRRGLSPQP